MLSWYKNSSKNRQKSGFWRFSQFNLVFPNHVFYLTQPQVLSKSFLDSTISCHSQHAFSSFRALSRSRIAFRCSEGTRNHVPQSHHKSHMHANSRHDRVPEFSSASARRRGGARTHAHSCFYTHCPTTAVGKREQTAS